MMSKNEYTFLTHLKTQHLFAIYATERCQIQIPFEFERDADSSLWNKNILGCLENV